MSFIDEVKAGASASVSTDDDSIASKAADRAPSLEISVSDEQIIIDATNLANQVEFGVIRWHLRCWPLTMKIFFSKDVYH